MKVKKTTLQLCPKIFCNHCKLRAISGPGHFCMPWDHLQINMEVVYFRSPFCTHGSQQRLPVAHSLLLMCLGNRCVLILRWVAISGWVSDATHLRVVSEAVESIRALDTLALLQRHHWRLSSGVGRRALVGLPVNCVKSHPDLWLGAALCSTLGAEAACQTGVA